jgi:hypothetical protein
MKAGTKLLALLALLAAIAPAAALGADAATDPVAKVDPATQRGTADRTLGGHVFVPTLLVRSPFAVTSFQMDVLYGAGDATGPALDVNGRPIGESTYSFAAMEQRFGYEGKLGDGLSLAGGVDTQLYSGIDGPSAVVVGVQVGVGLFGRFTAGKRLGPVHAAFTFDADYGPRYGILVLQAIQAAIDARELDSASAFSDQNVWTLKPGFAVAWAPHPLVGLTASADYQWLRLHNVDAGTDDRSGVDVGLAADVDVSKLVRAPVALVAGWHTTMPVGSPGLSRVVDYSAGAYYTGRAALVLGLELGWRSFTVRDLDTSMTVAQIRLQYLW